MCHLATGGDGTRDGEEEDEDIGPYITNLILGIAHLGICYYL